MSQISLPSQFLPASAALQNPNSKSINDLDSNDFLKLLVTELKNQDPREPADSVQMLQQVSQIRQITSNDAMITSLNSVQAGQEVATASQLVGKRISALSTDQQEVEGEVTRVSISPPADGNGPREIRLHVGEHQVQLSHVRSILPTAA
jgi:flagellar hook assembly protein FlgD